MCNKVPVMIRLHLEILKNNFGGQLRDSQLRDATTSHTIKPSICNLLIFRLNFA